MTKCLTFGKTPSFPNKKRPGPGSQNLVASQFKPILSLVVDLAADGHFLSAVYALDFQFAFVGRRKSYGVAREIENKFKANSQTPQAANAPLFRKSSIAMSI